MVYIVRINLALTTHIILHESDGIGCRVHVRLNSIRFLHAFLNTSEEYPKIIKITLPLATTRRVPRPRTMLGLRNAIKRKAIGVNGIDNDKGWFYNSMKYCLKLL